MANPYPVALRDTSDVERFSGAATFTDPANQPGGGGSQPGGVQTADFLFTEEATAGTYSASLPIAAKAIVLDVLLFPLVSAWAADTRVFTMEDTQGGAASYFDSLDPGGYGGDYNPVTPGTVGTLWDNLREAGNTYRDAGAIGGYETSNFKTNAAPGVRYAASDTITMTLVTTIATPPVVPTGVWLVKVIYTAAPTETAAAFA